MFQGDATAPNEAQQLLSRVLSGIEDSFCLIHNIEVASDDKESHLAALEEIFMKLLALGLTMCTDKLVLRAEEVEFLGFFVRLGGETRVIDKKVEVRAFLRFVGYVRKFIQGLSEIALPLFRLTPKEKLDLEDWTGEVEEAFDPTSETSCYGSPCVNDSKPKRT